MGGAAIREGKWHLISADNAARHIILHAHTPIFDKGHWPPWKSQVDKKCLLCSDHLKRNRMEHILGASNLFTPPWCRRRCNGKKWLQILALPSLETWWDTSLSYILWEKSVSNVYIPIPLGHSAAQRSCFWRTGFIKDISDVSIVMPSRNMRLFPKS